MHRAAELEALSVRRRRLHHLHISLRSMREELDGIEDRAARRGDATARTPARRDHLHISDLCVRKGLDDIEGLATLRRGAILFRVELPHSGRWEPGQRQV